MDINMNIIIYVMILVQKILILYFLMEIIMIILPRNALIQYLKVITLIQMIPYIKNVLKAANFVMEKEMKQIIIVKNVNQIILF